MRRIPNSAVVLALALLPATVTAQQASGQVIWTSGEVASINPDKRIVRPLAKGDAVHQGELISTGPDSHVQILMVDEGLIALRPDSSLRLSTYAYKGGKDGGEGVVLDLVKGGFRSITGTIGSKNKENFLIRTNTALVGIRGTDHETHLGPDGATYNRVTQGGTYLRSPHGRIDLAPGQAGFTLASAGPALLKRTPEFMHLTKVSVPAGAPFNEGVIAHGKRRLPTQASMPVLPAQALGDNARGKGWGKGGRCGGPCNNQKP